LLTPEALQADPDGYRQLAENLVEHGTFGQGETPTAYRPPLYPLALASGAALGSHWRTAIAVLHILLGVATVWLVLLLGRWWKLGDRRAVAAAILVACDPILLNQSTQVMTETMAAFLVVAGLLTLTWTDRSPTLVRNVVAGAALALGALCRPTLLPYAILVGVTLGMLRMTHLRCASPRLDGAAQPHGARLNAWQFVAALGAFALGMSVVLSPWALRNQMQFGRPIVTTTHGGYTLLLANNPEFYQWLRFGRWGDVWKADRFNAAWQQRKPRDELLADRLAYHDAWQTIRDEPGTFVRASMVRLGRFWSPLPHQVVADETPLRRLARHGVALWYTVEFFLAIAGTWFILKAPGRLSMRIPWLQALLLVVSMTAIHTLFWTDMRMRAPLMPVVALAAAAGWPRTSRESASSRSPTSASSPAACGD
jgi:hypothetical protein